MHMPSPSESSRVRAIIQTVPVVDLPPPRAPMPTLSIDVVFDGEDEFVVGVARGLRNHGGVSGDAWRRSRNWSSDDLL
jgi:hypothetical protein